MKFLTLIALGSFILNASLLSSSYAAKPRKGNANSCAEVLNSFQDKMNPRLRRALHSARGNKKFIISLLVSEPISEAGKLRNQLKNFGIELVRVDRTYLEVRGTKKSILTLLEDTNIRLTIFGLSELEWIGFAVHKQGFAKKTTQPLDVETLKRYKDTLKLRVQNIPGYNSIGFGNIDDGMGIQIYVETEADIKNFEEATIDYPVLVKFVVMPKGSIVPRGDSTTPATPETKQNVMVQLQWAIDGISLEQAKAILKEAGVEIDNLYPAVDLGIDGMIFLRGQATESAMKQAQERLKGVQFFADLQMVPVGGSVGGIGTFGPPQTAHPTDALALIRTHTPGLIRIGDVRNEVLLALPNRDRNNKFTLSIVFGSRADFNDLKRQLNLQEVRVKPHDNSPFYDHSPYVDQFIIGDKTDYQQAPYLVTALGTRDTLDGLLSRLTKLKPDATIVYVPKILEKGMLLILL